MIIIRLYLRIQKSLYTKKPPEEHSGGNKLY